MHIAFLLQDTGVIYGAERATLSLVRELCARDSVSVDVLLIQETRLPVAQRVLTDAFTAAGATVTSLTVDHAFSVRLIRKIHHVLASSSPDLLHTVGYKADLHGGLAARWARVPVVSTVHGWLFRPDWKERFYAQLNVITLRRMEQVIVLSRFYEDILKKRRIPKQRLRRIPSGLAVADGKSRRDRNGPLVVGMLGRLSYEKNQPMFLKAFAALRQRSVDARGIIAGTGPDEFDVRADIQSLGLADRVELAGYMDANDFFQNIDVLVICSRIENLPYSVLEAMAAGVPVIATRVGGLPDLVDDGVTGYLVASDDAIMLADRLDTLAQRPDLREQMGQAGQQKLRAEFTLEQCTAAHLELYDRVAIRGGGAASFSGS